MKSSFKPIITALAAGIALAGCSPFTTTDQPNAISVIDGKKHTNALQFDINNYTSVDVTVDNQTIKVRAYENIVYVASPVDSAYQSMNIYIPESYFKAAAKPHDLVCLDTWLDWHWADTTPEYLGAWRGADFGRLKQWGNRRLCVSTSAGAVTAW